MPYSARAVLFDAGQTLLEPTTAISEVYLREARAVGATLDGGAFLEHMAACWEALRAPPGEADLRSSETLEAAMWKTFTGRVAAPFQALADRHEIWLARLVEWFDDPRSWRPTSGAAELLESLRRNGRGVGVVSNWHAAVHDILEKSGLTRHLDFVVVSSEAGFRKPHPAIFADALRRCGVTAGEAVHIGDSLHDDVGGALGVGIRPILVCADPRPPSLPEGVAWVPSLKALLS